MNLFCLTFGVAENDHALALKIRRQLDLSVAGGDSFESFRAKIEQIKREHAQWNAQSAGGANG